MEKIQKTSSVIGKILSVLRGIVFGVGCAVAVFVVLAAFVPLEMIMDTEGMTRLYVELVLLQALLSLVFTWIMLGFLVKILRVMENGSPFGGAVSDALAKLAWIVLGFGIGGVIFDNVVSALKYAGLNMPADMKVTNYFLRTETDLGFIGVFGLLLLLSYVFRYGEELQRRDDETL